MKYEKIRKITVASVFVLVIIGLLFNTGTGTLSSFGWESIAAICPLGVLETALASRSMLLRVVFVLILTILFCIVVGKAFCAWICPVPTIQSFLEKTFKDKGLKKKDSAKQHKQIQKVSPCGSKHLPVDSRHGILLGTLVSSAIFGFPIFCLICPIGLTFGTIIILWQWFSLNTISWSLLLYPAILILELTLFRKWCKKICPLGALLSLFSLPNRLFRPKVDHSLCLQDKGAHCHKCAEQCPENLNPHLTDGMNECIKCGSCIDYCPAKAISFMKKPSDALQANHQAKSTDD